jgi:hypothetical protein
MEKDLYLLLFTGWKLVSFLLSKAVPNSICGILQEPKLPTPPVLGLVVGELVEVLLTTLPTTSTTATAAKSVLIPKTALNAEYPH